MKKSKLTLSLVAFTLMIGLATASISFVNAAPQDTGQLTKESPLTKVGEDDRYIYYEGTITLSGTYHEYHPNTIMGGLLCFTADEETGYLIPRPDNDTRTPWFCFDNQDEVKTIFGVNDQEIFVDESIECIEGKATIEVSNYIVDTLESETADKAKLEKVISKEPYSECK